VQQKRGHIDSLERLARVAKVLARRHLPTEAIEWDVDHRHKERAAFVRLQPRDEPRDIRRRIDLARHEQVVRLQLRLGDHALLHWLTARLRK
jgi:hypothetical protein